MIALSLTVLATVLNANPLPDNKTPIDSLTYTFTTDYKTGAGGSLTITKDGKVNFYYSTAPFTDSGEPAIQKKWELTKDERKELFAKLVADGLLEGSGSGSHGNEIRVKSGRWYATLEPANVPEKAMKHLQPYLGTLQLPAKKVDAKEPPAPKPGVLNAFGYYHVPKEQGDQITLYLRRDGRVNYRRFAAGQTHANEAWMIPAKDAETLLDALASDGVCNLEDVGHMKTPIHRIEVRVGRWQTVYYTKEPPEKIAKHLLPLLKKADPEFWK